jgi:protein involved in polysaccharide export with SLBB domain
MTMTDDPVLSGYPAQIALPSERRYTTNRIEVTVHGDVAASGRVQLPEGSTVLEAISRTGGFLDYARKSQLRVTRKSGTRFKLYLRSHFVAGARHRLVWYDVKVDGNAMKDFVLEDGDEIHVARAIF